MTTVTIPATREEALAAIVALDCATYGEAERAASDRLRRAEYPTYGLALSGLAHRPEYDFGDAVPHLVAAAKRALTASDRAYLRR